MGAVQPGAGGLAQGGTVPPLRAARPPPRLKHDGGYDGASPLLVGEADDVAARLHELAERWGAEELLVVTYAHDAAARRRSYELLARAW